jgi:hypothetical protein
MIPDGKVGADLFWVEENAPIEEDDEGKRVHLPKKRQLNCRYLLWRARCVIF